MASFPIQHDLLPLSLFIGFHLSPSSSLRYSSLFALSAPAMLDLLRQSLWIYWLQRPLGWNKEDPVVNQQWQTLSSISHLSWMPSQARRQRRHGRTLFVSWHRMLASSSATCDTYHGSSCLSWPRTRARDSTSPWKAPGILSCRYSSLFFKHVSWFSPSPPSWLSPVPFLFRLLYYVIWQSSLLSGQCMDPGLPIQKWTRGRLQKLQSTKVSAGSLSMAV